MAPNERCELQVRIFCPFIAAKVQKDCIRPRIKGGKELDRIFVANDYKRVAERQKWRQYQICELQTFLFNREQHSLVLGV
jgi:hypothetical protein